MVSNRHYVFLLYKSFFIATFVREKRALDDVSACYSFNCIDNDDKFFLENIYHVDEVTRICTGHILCAE